MRNIKQNIHIFCSIVSIFLSGCSLPRHRPRIAAPMRFRSAFDSQFLTKCFLVLYYSTFCAPALLPRMRNGLTQVSRSNLFIISVLFVQTNGKGCDKMSAIICHANCVFQKDGNCNYKYSTRAGLPSCCENGCVYYIPRALSVRGVQWHEAPHQCSAPQSLSDRQTSQAGQNAAWE